MFLCCDGSPRDKREHGAPLLYRPKKTPKDNININKKGIMSGCARNSICMKCAGKSLAGEKQIWRLLFCSVSKLAKKCGCVLPGRKQTATKCTNHFLIKENVYKMMFGS